ncbi:MAG TPA: hypothetical protein VNO70_06795 [Blastocatellia bacterium]|nr:hypothetical protein [Blastocatellia bacterium]
MKFPISNLQSPFEISNLKCEIPFAPLRPGNEDFEISNLKSEIPLAPLREPGLTPGQDAQAART